MNISIYKLKHLLALKSWSSKGLPLLLKRANEVVLTAKSSYKNRKLSKLLPDPSLKYASLEFLCIQTWNDHFQEFYEWVRLVKVLGKNAKILKLIRVPSQARGMEVILTKCLTKKFCSSRSNTSTSLSNSFRQMLQIARRVKVWEEWCQTPTNEVRTNNSQSIRLSRSKKRGHYLKLARLLEDLSTWKLHWKEMKVQWFP